MRARFARLAPPVRSWLSSGIGHQTHTAYIYTLIVDTVTRRYSTASNSRRYRTTPSVPRERSCDQLNRHERRVLPTQATKTVAGSAETGEPLSDQAGTALCSTWAGFIADRRRSSRSTTRRASWQACAKS